MDASMAGKRALVCGASGGIGAATARALSEAGVEVLLLARSADKLAALAKETGGTAVVADLQDRPGLASRVAALLDDGPIHVLINKPQLSQGRYSHVDPIAAGLPAHALTGPAGAQQIVEARWRPLHGRQQPGEHPAGHVPALQVHARARCRLEPGAVRRDEQPVGGRRLGAGCALPSRVQAAGDGLGELAQADTLQAFGDKLEIPEAAKRRLRALTPATYVGNAADQARKISEV